MIIHFRKMADQNVTVVVSSEKKHQQFEHEFNRFLSKAPLKSMEEICRLCCSSNFVSNDIFDEETALYLKMSLYLPIKVFKNDRLPQKICDKCSCKVNDFYQFCNEAIEVQNRLRAALLVCHKLEPEESVDLTLIKENAHSPIVPETKLKCEQSTQTEDIPSQVNMSRVKMEPVERPASPYKPDIPPQPGYNYMPDNYSSDESDNISLVKLQQKKKVKKEIGSLLNGEAPKKRGRKKQKLQDLELIWNSLPEGGSMDLLGQHMGMGDECEVNLDLVKREDFDLPFKVMDPSEFKKVKEEENRSYLCCMCDAECHSRREMLAHYRNHVKQLDGQDMKPVIPPLPESPDVPLRCNRCNKTLTALTWTEHWSKHWEKDRRPFRCKICERAYADPAQILKHAESHKRDGPLSESADLPKRFMCDVCPEQFVYMRHMLSHRTVAHPEVLLRQLQFRCAYCARAFAHLNSLRRHLRRHEAPAPAFLCNVCGKSLSSREHLKFHLRIHTGTKPHACKTCGKAFVKKCNLVLHERVHSGEKPHVCTHCGKAFSQRSTLVIHERYHSGARPYVCDLCGRGFVARGLLSMHAKTSCV